MVMFLRGRGLGSGSGGHCYGDKARLQSSYYEVCSTFWSLEENGCFWFGFGVRTSLFYLG
jgi:hypothetical protein